MKKRDRGRREGGVSRGKTSSSHSISPMVSKDVLSSLEKVHSQIIKIKKKSLVDDSD